MRLALQHVHSSKIGYGQLGVELARSLARQGVEVVNPQLTPEQFDAGEMPKTNAILWVTVPSHARGSWDGSKVWAFTMWEATRLPEVFTESFDQFTGFIVPNDLNLAQFQARHDNVHKVPLGVDPELWATKLRRMPGAFLDFLICGAGPRKGTDLAYKAFHDAFPHPEKLAPSPRLIMKNHKEDFGGAAVMRIGQRLSDEELVALYHSAHVYVQPSRGEGWGLQPHQALATGMPAIISDIPGHREYAHLPGLLSIPTKPVKSAYFIYGDAGDWWEPDYDALVVAYREMWSNYALWAERGLNGATEVRRHFTWDHTARGVVEAIGPDVLAAPYSGSGRWCPAPQRKYLVITNRDWTADIAGLSYFFRKGHRYHELADVKRILYEAGLLDPACLDGAAILPDGAGEMGHGLTDEQVAGLREYSARFENCPTCGQALNQPTEGLVGTAH